MNKKLKTGLIGLAGGVIIAGVSGCFRTIPFPGSAEFAAKEKEISYSLKEIQNQDLAKEVISWYKEKKFEYTKEDSVFPNGWKRTLIKTDVNDIELKAYFTPNASDGKLELYVEKKINLDHPRITEKKLSLMVYYKDYDKLSKWINAREEFSDVYIDKKTGKGGFDNSLIRYYNFDNGMRLFIEAKGLRFGRFLQDARFPRQYQTLVELVLKDTADIRREEQK